MNRFSLKILAIFVGLTLAPGVFAAQCYYSGYYDNDNDYETSEGSDAEYSDNSTICVNLLGSPSSDEKKSCLKDNFEKNDNAGVSEMATADQKKPKGITISAPSGQIVCNHIPSEQECIMKQIAVLKECSVAAPIVVMQAVPTDVGSALVAYMETVSLESEVARIEEEMARLKLAGRANAAAAKESKESIEKSNQVKDSLLARMRNRKAAREAILAKLIRHQINDNDQDKNGNTLLHLCMLFDYEQGVRALLNDNRTLLAENMVNVDLRNKAGKDFLHCGQLGYHGNIQQLFRVYVERKREKAAIDALRPNYLTQRIPLPTSCWSRLYRFLFQ